MQIEGRIRARNRPEDGIIARLHCNGEKEIWLVTDAFLSYTIQRTTMEISVFTFLCYPGIFTVFAF